MALPESDSTVGHSFGLEFDGITIKEISEVAGLKMDQDVIEYKHNTPDGKYLVKKLPGRPKPGELTLTRGLTKNNSFDDWVKNAQVGNMGNARKGGSIIVYDFEGQEIKRYKLRNMWPKGLELSGLKAGDTSVLTEKLTVTYEEMTPGS